MFSCSAPVASSAVPPLPAIPARSALISASTSQKTTGFDLHETGNDQQPKLWRVYIPSRSRICRYSAVDQLFNRVLNALRGMASSFVSPATNTLPPAVLRRCIERDDHFAGRLKIRHAIDRVLDNFVFTFFCPAPYSLVAHVL